MTEKKRKEEKLKPTITRQELERRVQKGIKLITDSFSWAHLGQLSKSEQKEFNTSAGKIVENFLRRIFRIVENDAKK